MVKPAPKKKTAAKKAPAKTKKTAAASKPDNAIAAKVLEIVAKQIKKKPADVPSSAKLQELGADSLDAMEIVFQLEEAFGIRVEESAASQLGTVDDIVAYVTKQTK